MNLYLISQNANAGYDTYDSAVVAAPNEETAKQMYPGSITGKRGGNYFFHDWVEDSNLVNCRLIGKATKGTMQSVILGSYNAG